MRKELYLIPVVNMKYKDVKSVYVSSLGEQRVVKFKDIQWYAVIGDVLLECAVHRDRRWVISAAGRPIFGKISSLVDPIMRERVFNTEPTRMCLDAGIHKTVHDTYYVSLWPKEDNLFIPAEELYTDPKPLNIPNYWKRGEESGIQNLSSWVPNQYKNWCRRRNIHYSGDMIRGFVFTAQVTRDQDRLDVMMDPRNPALKYLGTIPVSWDGHLLRGGNREVEVSVGYESEVLSRQFQELLGI